MTRPKGRKKRESDDDCKAEGCKRKAIPAPPGYGPSDYCAEHLEECNKRFQAVNAHRRAALRKLKNDCIHSTADERELRPVHRVHYPRKGR